MLDTSWFARRKWGVFCHYLTSAETSVDDWNRRVDSVDVDALARQLVEVGAGYFFLTVGQGSGHYCAPNETYDALVGLSPGKCSRRDLISDLHAALAPHHIDLLVYVATDGSNADPVARQALGLTAHWHEIPGNWGSEAYWAQFRLPHFHRNWEAICRDWSMRWGSRVKGWWVDAAYGQNVRFPEGNPPNLYTLGEALRAGNPAAIIAFNPGVRVEHYTDAEDYTAGEIAETLPECKAGVLVRPSGHQALYHILSYLGEFWGRGPVRFPDAMVCGYTQHVVSKGGVVTWDVPISPDGVIPEPFFRQLCAIGKALDTQFQPG